MQNLIGFANATVEITDGDVERTLRMDNADLSKECSAYLWECLQSGVLCDVQLVAASGDKIPAHKLVLMAGSPVLRTMILGESKEAKENLISVEKCESDVLQMIVNYFYTGSMEIHEGNAHDVMEAAYYLLVPHIVQACFQLSNGPLDTSNFWDYYSFASQHNYLTLKEEVKAMICEKFSEASLQQGFLSIEFKDLLGFCNSEVLSVPNEDNLYESMKAWVMNSPERGVHMKELLEQLEPALLSSGTLVDIFMQSMGESGSPRILKALTQRIDLSKTPEPNNAGYKRRNYKDGLFLVFVGTKNYNDFEISVDLYNMRNNTMSQYLSQGVFKNQSHFGVAVTQNYASPQKVLIIGGSTAEGCTDTVKLFDLEAKTFEDVGSMRTARQDVSTAVINSSNTEFVYAIGGKNQTDGVINEVDKWNMEMVERHDVASLNIARYRCGVAVLNNKIYVAGGLGKDGLLLDSVEELCEERKSWVMRCPMRYSKGLVSLWAHEGFLYAVGSHTVEQYDPSTDNWSKVTDLPSYCEYSIAILWGEEICVYSSEPYSQLYLNKYHIKYKQWLKMNTNKYNAMQPSKDNSIVVHSNLQNIFYS